MDTPTLIKLCIKQDRRAQKMLFDQYKGMIMGVCLRYAKDHSEAEDIFQEVFIKVFANLSKLKDPEALGGWAKSTAVRTAINHYKKSLKHRYQPIEDNNHSKEMVVQDDQEIIGNIDREILLKYLHELPDNQRLVFNLAALEGYQHKETAQMLGITEASSRVYLAQARRKLQKSVLVLFNRSKENYET